MQNICTKPPGKHHRHIWSFLQEKMRIDFLKEKNSPFWRGKSTSRGKLLLLIPSAPRFLPLQSDSELTRSSIKYLHEFSWLIIFLNFPTSTSPEKNATVVSRLFHDYILIHLPNFIFAALFYTGFSLLHIVQNFQSFSQIPAL